MGQDIYIHVCPIFDGLSAEQAFDEVAFYGVGSVTRPDLPREYDKHIMDAGHLMGNFAFEKWLDENALCSGIYYYLNAELLKQAAASSDLEGPRCAFDASLGMDGVQSIAARLLETVNFERQFVYCLLSS